VEKLQENIEKNGKESLNGRPKPNFMGYYQKEGHKPTCVIVVMEVGVECMCSNTNAFESQGKYIHEQTIDDE